MRYSVETDYKLFFRNLVQYRWFATVMFCLVALLMTIAGFFVPKTYSSYSTVLLDGQTTIAPLIGADDQANANDWSKVAQEILQSRKTMTKLMQQMGYIDDEIKTQADEILLERIKANTIIHLEGNDKILRIEYRDADPLVAKAVAEKLTNIFIEGTHGYRSAESQEAFEFIDQQVNTYHKKLREAEERLKQFKTEKLVTGASSEAAVASRISRLQEVLDQSELDLKEARIQRDALDKQLRTEVRNTVSIGRQSRYVKQLETLNEELSRLRLTYHENYPDIVNIKHQIEDLRRQINLEKRGSSMDLAGIDVKSNEVYQDIRKQLGDAETRIATLETRIDETRSIIEQERKKGELVNESDAEEAELVRDYNVNKKLYEDLLKRRESARVTKEIDDQHKGLNIKVDSPAFVPQTPSGFRFVHFVAAGLLLGLLIPAGLIYLYQIVDSAVKSPEMIQSKMKLNVLGMMPDIVNADDLAEIKRKDALRGSLIWVTMAGIGIIGALKVFTS
ncbi:MAG: XrtA system polysaccharide chain length determinant [Thiotrichales bacterium]